MPPRVLQGDELQGKGDIWQGIRLPEYRDIPLGTPAPTCPIHYIGRYVVCEIHGDTLTRNLSINPGSSPLPCQKISRLWHQSFANLQRPIFLGFDSRQLVEALMEVKAVIQQRIRRHINLSYRQLTEDLDYNGNPLSRPTGDVKSLVKMWLDNPDFAADAHEHGCTYNTWSVLLQLGAPQLARHHFVDDRGELTPLTQTLIKTYGKRLAQVVTIYDQVQAEVNVYGFIAAHPDAAFLLPVSDNIENLQHAIKSTLLWRDHSTANNMAETLQQVDHKDDPYTAVDINHHHISQLREFGIAPSEASAWTEQALDEPQAMLSAKNLEQRQPDLPKGQVAFAISVLNEEWPFMPLRPLTPLDPDCEWSLENGAFYPEGTPKHEMLELQAQAWEAKFLPHYLDTPEADELIIS